MKLQGGQEAEAEFSRAGLRLKGTGYRLKTIAVMLRNNCMLDRRAFTRRGDLADAL